MKNHLFFFTTICSLISATSCAKLKLANKYYLSPCYYDSPVRQSDFPQHFLEIDLDQYTDEIRSHHQFEVDTIEVINYQSVDYPVLRINHRGRVGEKKLLILAGVHGNESGGTLAVPRLLSKIEDFPARYKNWDIQIITPVNPVGTVFMSRYNENGCDLNRKVKKSTQKGVVIQREAIIEFEPDIVLNLHEAPYTGFLIHPTKEVNRQLCFDILKSIEHDGILLSTEDYHMGRELTPPGFSPLKGIGKFFSKLFSVQPLDDFVAKSGIPLITTESGWNSPDPFQRIDSHLLFIDGVIEHFEKTN